MQLIVCDLAYYLRLRDARLQLGRSKFLTVVERVVQILNVAYLRIGTGVRDLFLVYLQLIIVIENVLSIGENGLHHFVLILHLRQHRLLLRYPQAAIFNILILISEPKGNRRTGIDLLKIVQLFADHLT